MEPPDLCKYRPRMAVVRPKPNAAVIHHMHKNFGENRKNVKGRAQLSFCNRLCRAMMDQKRGARLDMEDKLVEAKGDLKLE